jgi:hypothetical protein
VDGNHPELFLIPFSFASKGRVDHHSSPRAIGR